MSDSDICLYDVTLRDGSHALDHKINEEQIKRYATLAEAAGVSIIEVGHGIGLGASSLQIGRSHLSDQEMICIAREQVEKSKLGIHVTPGFATIEKDLKKALDWGVEVFRIAAHCTEADITERHISFIREQGKVAYGALMMSHMASVDELVEEALKMESYGANGVSLLDSAGAMLPDEVVEKVSTLKASLDIPIGFHAHNNLGMAIANSIVAYDCGARIIDGAISGLGGGAGNASLELIVAVLLKKEVPLNIDFYKLLDAADKAEELFASMPKCDTPSIVSGMAGVVSVFLKPVVHAAKTYNIDSRDLFFELGRLKTVAGQEDLIVEVAKKISSTRG